MCDTFDARCSRTCWASGCECKSKLTRSKLVVWGPCCQMGAKILGAVGPGMSWESAEVPSSPL
eukprot:scaffold8604_cov168-Amphora_coffeaeformis.AAC.4